MNILPFIMIISQEKRMENHYDEVNGMGLAKAAAVGMHMCILMVSETKNL